MEFRIRGIIVPTVTPFDGNGEIDASRIGRLVDHLIECGVAGLFSGGTTGEGFLLGLDERRFLADEVVGAADGRIPVIVHAGRPTTAETVTLTQHARGVGAQAAAVIPPYVYHHDDEALLRHYVTVAGSAPEFPLYLYNFPAISNNTLTLELVRRIMTEAPNVVGMKDSSGSLETLVQLLAATDGCFSAINGGDGQALMALAMGFDGCISGNANVVPELMVALYNAVVAGNLDEARRCQQKVNRVRMLLGDGENLSIFKRMLGRRGVEVGEVRAPLVPVTSDALEEVANQMGTLLLDSR